MAKKTVERDFCDFPRCPNEASWLCPMCGYGFCEDCQIEYGRLDLHFELIPSDLTKQSKCHERQTIPHNLYLCPLCVIALVENRPEIVKLVWKHRIKQAQAAIDEKARKDFPILR